MHLFIFFSEGTSIELPPDTIERARRISAILLDQTPSTLESIGRLGLSDSPKCDFSTLPKPPTSLRCCSSLADRGEDWQIVGLDGFPVTVAYHLRYIMYMFGLWNEPSQMPSFMRDFMEVAKVKCPEFYQELFDARSLADTLGRELFVQIERLAPSRRVCRADICRYELMRKRGGLYMDLDVRVRRDLRELIDECVRDGVEVLLFTEHDHCDSETMGARENKSYTKRIYNCMFWSVPDHPIWKECVDLAWRRCEILGVEGNEWSDTDVIWATGPDVITTVWTERFKDDERVRVLNNNDTMMYLHHMYKGTWRMNEDAARREP